MAGGTDSHKDFLISIIENLAKVTSLRLKSRNISCETRIITRSSKLRVCKKCPKGSS